MTSKRTVSLLVLALLACSTQPSVGSRFNGPSAIVAFEGVTGKVDGVATYLAVATSRGDELRILDPDDLQPVLGPGAVFPLSIPTAPRPLLVASASLADGGADVLAVVSAGGSPFGAGSGPVLQVVDTWSGENRVAFDVHLDAADVLGAGAEVLSLAGMNAEGGRPARILVGAEGGRLVVVEFVRCTGTSLPPECAVADGSARARQPTAANVNQLGFDPLDIAVEPAGTNLFIATRGSITATAGGTPVNGVAVVDASGVAPAPWSVTALDARAPTVAVAAERVDERRVASTDPCSPERFAGAVAPPPFVPPLRVYAALSPDSCGSDKPINCGIVTLDPSTGTLATDPAGEAGLTLNPPGSTVPGGGPTVVPAQAYRAPIPLPVSGLPIRIAIGKAPARGNQQFTGELPAISDCATEPQPASSPLFKIAPTTGQRYTSAVAMVTSSDGRVYWLDLSRWGPASDVSTMVGGSRVNVTSASSVAVADTQPRIGLWLDTPASGSTPSVTVDAGALPSAIQVWPGFTPAGTWSLVWQGALPSLESRPGIVFTSSAGLRHVAIQTATGPTGPPWVVGARISDASLGVRPGDSVELSDGCTTTVVEVVPADLTTAAVGIAIPGGAARVEDAACLGAPAAGGFVAKTITVRTPGLVLGHETLGYLGRPGIGLAPDFGGSFSVEWLVEDALPPEQLAIARKARRRFYPSNGPCPLPGASAGTQGALAVGCYDGFPRLSEPLAPGPMIRFRVGIVPPVAGTPFTPPTATTCPDCVRGSGVTFTTQEGLSTTSRRPSSGGALPTGVIPFDRTGVGDVAAKEHTNDPIFFFVPYLDDLVLLFSPSDSTLTTVR